MENYKTEIRNLGPINVNAIEEFKVLKGNITPVLNMVDYSYGSEKPEPTITGNSGDGVVVYYYNTTNSTESGEVWATVTNGLGLNVGTYYMYAVIDETTNYNGLTTEAKEFKADSGSGLVAMMKIMDTVGVEKWEDLKGKYCRVKTEGWGGQIKIIGNIIEDKWFDMGEFFKSAEKEETK